MLSDDAKKELQRRSQVAEKNAKQVLKKGDRLRVSKYPGTKRWIVFSHFDGHWIVSKSGIDDYSPCSVDRVGNARVDFTVDCWLR